MRTADVLQRIEAWRSGAPVATGDTLPWPRAQASRTASSWRSSAWRRSSPVGRGCGPTGRGPDNPHRSRAARCRGARATRTRFRQGTAPAPAPSGSRDRRREGVLIGGVAARRQLWMPGPTHVEMLHLLDYRFSRAKEREDADARALGKVGRACGWLFRESTRPGQVRVFDATARLKEAFAFPAEDVRQQHLGFLPRVARERRPEGCPRGGGARCGAGVGRRHDAPRVRRGALGPSRRTLEWEP